MTKKDRELIFNKYGGCCAYCGDPLQKGWHVDEIQPVVRNKTWDADKRRYVIYKEKPMQYPERMHIDNQMPACASCNINKHSMSLEEFRELISGFIKHLTVVNTQYKIAKRYGLVQETGREVKFYFETINLTK